MSDHVDKASKMADMQWRAIHTTENVFNTSSLRIFDKEIAPIVLCANAIWATPKSFNLSCLNNLDDEVNARTKASHVLCDILCKQISIEYAHRLILMIFKTWGKTKLMY